MGDVIAAVKSGEEEPVPTVWRGVFAEIVQRMVDGNFDLHGIDGVVPLYLKDALAVKKYIEFYGERLGPLPEESWKTSICRWMGAYWVVLVDLFNEQGKAIDLVIFSRVQEDGDRYKFIVDSVHVP